MSANGQSISGDQNIQHNVFVVASDSSVAQTMFTSGNLERGQFEVDEHVSTLKIPRQCAKECIQNYQLLPAKIRQMIKIGTVIILLSTVIFVTLFYISQISESPVYQNDIADGDIHAKDVNFEETRFSPEIKQHPKQAEVKETPEKGNIQIPYKVFKDIQGKARAYDNLQSDIKSKPSELPTKLDLKRKSSKRQRQHPATADEINKTLAIVRDRVDQGRKQIKSKELRLWEPGTEPMRILLVSTWRSGSTFLGSVIQSHPGVFQHYEPLSHFGIRQIRSGKDAFIAQQLIHNLLDCQYAGATDYLNYLYTHPEDMVGHNTHISVPCNMGPNLLACRNETFLTKSCKMFPIQMVKTVRMRLNMTQLLVNDEKLRAKVIFLVRDPRGIMSSRYSSVKWCTSNTECASPTVLCEDMERDIKVATAFQKLYPDRFISMKYEDLAENPKSETLKLFKFLGLEYTSDTSKFIKNYTTTNFDAPWSIKRKSVERISLWKKLLPLIEIHDVQNSCKSVMKTLNYDEIS